MNRRVERLTAAGVEIWLDTLSRDLLTSGHFGALMADFGITGATSNPTIFATAITGSTSYDGQLAELLAAGIREPRQLFFHLALDDVGHAADLLRPTYESSGGRHGFVSFECTPDVADDTEATVDQAMSLWRRLARPNMMIKVPATDAGIPAIEQLTAQGVSVNVTLLFGLPRYDQAIDAYLGGIEKRLAAGQSVTGIASVASFFVSRVDQKADALLTTGSPLLGKVAVANAQRAYAHFHRRFSGPSWRDLQEHGAVAQRPLWASTATKNASYSDVLYVEELIGPDVVNTMPAATLHAFADHGEIRRTLSGDGRAATRLLDHLDEDGINLSQMTSELEKEGLAAFSASYRQLLSCLTARAEQLTAQSPSA